MGLLKIYMHATDSELRSIRENIKVSDTKYKSIVTASRDVFYNSYKKIFFTSLN